MAGIYRQRHQEHTVFYPILFHYFEDYLRKHENLWSEIGIGMLFGMGM